MKRHKVTVGEIAKVVQKSYPPTLNKFNMKETEQGKLKIFDIIEAKQIIDYLLKKEKEFLEEKFGDEWQSEWQKRWGHITDWFSYFFYDEVVTIVDESNVSNF